MEKTEPQNALVKVEVKKRKIRQLLVLAFFAIAIIVSYVTYRGNYLETLELGEQYLNVFWKNVVYQVSTFFTNFIVLFFTIYITNKRIKKGLVPFFEEEKKKIPKMPNKSIAFIVSLIVSFLVTNMMLKKLMLCINLTAFEITDPVIGLDIGYFIFVQPFLQFLLRYLIYIAVGLTIYAAFYYIIVFNFLLDGVSRETLKKSKLLNQLCNNIIVIAILIAITIFVETFNVGLQRFINLGSYAIWGAGISEVTIKLWGYRILSVIIVVSVIIAMHHLKKKNTKKVLTSLAVVPEFLLAMLVVLIGFNVIFVNSNELDKQQEYIKANIQSTKQAYGINIDEVSLGENETITKEILNQNINIIDNIDITNKDIVLNNLNTSQTNKGYYTYRNTQVALKNVDGNQTLVYISPREITDSAGTYNNKTYQYTHGYGVIVTSASKVNENGTLIHLQKGFENTENDIISISEPRIYFGLEAKDTIVTNSNGKKEFDYPLVDSATAENAENIYDGQAGLNLKFLDRLVLAFKEHDLKLAFSGKVNSNSKILINRNIIERAKTLMPYVLYDENPYLVTTNEGKLVWVIDGYTVTECYPYSQRISLDENNLLKRMDINYIRNSLKVLIDAYDGTINYYITDKNDPIISAYQKIYPELFIDDTSLIPEEIKEQFIYPEFLYNIQAEILERYHNVQTDVLYRQDDIWNIATHNTSKVTTKVGTEITPYYTMLKTVDNENATLGLVLPYTPKGKQSLISYLVGRYENGEAKLTLYKYQTDSNVLGPMQIDTQLEQDERISEEISELNALGTRISKNMIVIPINNSLLYVEPIYQQYVNDEKATPILRKIIVASGNKVAIGDTLKEALTNLISQNAVDIEIESTDDIEGVIDAIIKANQNLKQSNKNNNWEMAGKDMSKLQELITKLEELMKENKNNKDSENKVVSGNVLN